MSNLVNNTREIVIKISNQIIELSNVPNSATVTDILKSAQSEYAQQYGTTPPIIIPNGSTHAYTTMYAEADANNPNGNSIYRAGDKIISGDTVLPNNYKQVTMALLVVKSSAGAGTDDEGTFSFVIKGSGKKGMKAIAAMFSQSKEAFRIPVTSNVKELEDSATKVYDVSDEDVTEVPYESSLIEDKGPGQDIKVSKVNFDKFEEKILPKKQKTNIPTKKSMFEDML
jgi:hypothetical protein